MVMPGAASLAGTGAAGLVDDDPERRDSEAQRPVGPVVSVSGTPWRG